MLVDPWSIVAGLFALLAWDTLRRYLQAQREQAVAENARRIEKDRLDTYEKALRNGLEQLSAELVKTRQQAGAAALSANVRRR